VQLYFNHQNHHQQLQEHPQRQPESFKKTKKVGKNCGCVCKAFFVMLEVLAASMNEI
jgi:hypothetical protein